MIRMRHVLPILLLPILLLPASAPGRASATSVVVTGGAAGAVGSVAAIVAHEAIRRRLGNHRIESFARAKELLAGIHAGNPVTLCCGFRYDGGEIDIPDGFAPPELRADAARLRWTHLISPEEFGRALPEWRRGAEACVDDAGRPFRGRECAEKASGEFRRMVADMHNIWPSSEAVHALRDGLSHADLSRDAGVRIGICGAKTAAGNFEPPDRAKGVVARAGLYMAENYVAFRLPFRLSRLFEAWDRMFPVTEWECRRARLVEEIQGNRNSRVRDPCRKRRWW